MFGIADSTLYSMCAIANFMMLMHRYANYAMLKVCIEDFAMLRPIYGLHGFPLNMGTPKNFYENARVVFSPKIPIFYCPIGLLYVFILIAVLMGIICHKVYDPLSTKNVNFLYTSRSFCFAGIFK